MPIFGHISLESQDMTMKLWGNHQSIGVSWFRVNLMDSSKSQGHHCWVIEWSLMPKIPAWSYNLLICRDMTMKLRGYHHIIDLCWFLKLFWLELCQQSIFKKLRPVLCGTLQFSNLIDNFDQNCIIFISNRGSIQ